MPETSKLEKLNWELEKSEKKLRKAINDEKALQHQLKQLTTVTEEIEELKSRKEQLTFQAECSTDKDMTNLSKKYDQINNNLDILDSQDISLKKQLEKDAAAFREEKFRPEPLWKRNLEAFFYSDWYAGRICGIHSIRNGGSFKRG